MFFFGKRKKEEDEDISEEKSFGKPIKKVRRREKDIIRPWGRTERYFVLFAFLITAAVSGILAASARSWKLPGFPSISLPNLSFEETFVIESGKEKTFSEKEAIPKDIQQQILQKIADLSGVYSVLVYTLDNKRSWAVNEEKTMQAASLIKLPVMAFFLKEIEKGTLSFEKIYSLLEADKIAGSGSLFSKPAGTKVTYKELIRLMGKSSDNTAFGIARKILKDENIMAFTKGLGMSETDIDENTTSASDIKLFFQKLWDGDILSSQENVDFLLESLTLTAYEDFIPKSVPEGVRVAHKYGRETHVINDAGIIFSREPYILVLLTKGVVEKDAEQALVEISKLIYDSF